MIERRQKSLRRRRGFTLVELCLGLIITGLIASATSAMMLTVARYWTHGSQLDKNSAAINQLAARLQQSFQDAKCVGYVQSGLSSTAPAAIAFWLHDTNGDGLIQQSELTVIRFNPGLQRLEIYGADPSASSTGGNAGGGSSGINGGLGGTIGSGGTTIGGSSNGPSDPSDPRWTFSDLRASTAVANIIAQQSARTVLNHVTSAEVDVAHLDETSVTPVVSWNLQLENDGDGFREPIVVSLRAPLTPG